MVSSRAIARGTFVQLLGAAVGVARVGRLPAAAAPPITSVPSAEALARLTAGNTRFVAGTMTNQHGVLERRMALAGGQAPFATILACSDSRVGPELVYDQHVGDLFVVRNAGNFVTDAVLGTIEYGYSALGSKLIVVLGHDSCGAISATYDAIKSGVPLKPHLDAIEHGIAEGIARVVAAHGTKNAASSANARAQAAKLGTRSSVLHDGVASGDLRVVAAAYHLGDGHVTLLA
ncbi:MAG: carbonic anhydrase [Candidatus Baltobacteraceae bacterium]